MTKSFGVSACVSNALASVTVDRDYLAQRIAQILDGNHANPINALLGIFGLKIVSKNGAMQELDSLMNENLVVEADTGTQVSFLRLNEAAIRTAADQMAQNLRKIEDQWREETAARQEEANKLRIELDQSRQETEAQRSALTRQRQAAAEQIQYILSILGPEKNKTSDMLGELLEDLNLTARWNADGTSLLESAMFSVLKCSGPESRKMKPCILSEDGVMVKGLRFTKA
ncbi:MAG: hypothetical protein IK099_07580 [Clostridia bacterium]|nr:hypothetical protein [Clostridia bacterium]